ncbi:MAG: cyclase [Actinomycetota bacterium]
MPVFDFRFTVDASLEQVSAFHHGTEVLQQLTPPPTIMRVHEAEPLGEGSVSRFTVWFGPLPIRWEATHSDVSENGFTDTQTSGPMRRWVHTHRFSEIAPGTVEVHEHIEYEHGGGAWGVLTRLLFSKPALLAQFTFRKLVTRRKAPQIEV